MGEKKMHELFSKIRHIFSKEEFFTEGGYRDLFMISYPLILMSASNVIMQFADRKFLGNNATEELAAALNSGILYFTLFCFFLVSINFTSTLIAQYYGKNDLNSCVKTTWTGFYFTLMILPFFIMLLPCGFYILKYSMSETLFPYAWQYFTGLLPSGFFSCLGVPFYAFFSGRGKTQIVAIINIGVCMMNILLDWIMIFGKFGCPKMNILGAGLATSISAGLGFLAIFIVFCCVDQKQYKTRAFKNFSWSIVRKLLGYGAPAGLQVVSDVGSFTVMLMIIGKLGDVALAASAIAFSINNLSFSPLMGISDATAIIAGQGVGKNKKDITASIPYRAMYVALLYMGITGLFYILCSDFLITMFKPADMGNMNFNEVAETGKNVLMLAACWNLLDAVRYTVSGGLRGAGDTKYLMIVNIICAWGLGVSGIFAMVFLVKANIFWVWGYLIFAIAAEAILLLYRLRSG